MESEIDPIITKMAENLGALGYSPTDSLVLSYFLLHPDNVTSQDIERATWLRQPQVSLSITSLRDKKWIKKLSVTPVPIGHPVVNYSLICTPDELCNRIRDAILNEMELKITTLGKVGYIIHHPEGGSLNEAC